MPNDARVEANISKKHLIYIKNKKVELLSSVASNLSVAIATTIPIGWTAVIGFSANPGSTTYISMILISIISAVFSVVAQRISLRILDNLKDLDQAET